MPADDARKEFECIQGEVTYMTVLLQWHHQLYDGPSGRPEIRAETADEFFEVLDDMLRQMVILTLVKLHDTHEKCLHLKHIIEVCLVDEDDGVKQRASEKLTDSMGQCKTLAQLRHGVIAHNHLKLRTGRRTVSGVMKWDEVGRAVRDIQDLTNFVGQHAFGDGMGDFNFEKVEVYGSASLLLHWLELGIRYDQLRETLMLEVLTPEQIEKRVGQDIDESWAKVPRPRSCL